MKAGFENPSTKGEGRHIILAQYYELQACNVSDEQRASPRLTQFG